MAQVKSQQELELMKVSGAICAQALKKVLEHLKIGTTGRELDDIAREEIEKQGAQSSFMTVDDYKWTICITFNEQVVHGIPTERKVKNGDVVSIDIGALYKGYHSDMATSVAVGKVDKETENFINTGKRALEAAIKNARVGNKVGDISATLQEIIEGEGYEIVKNLTGHGVGKELHEDPMIPGFGKRGVGQELKEGMTIAIEAIYAKKSGKIRVDADNWTISTADGSLGGLFEKTVAISKSGPIVLTPYLWN